VVGADPAACVDELFGPVVTVHPVDDDEAAVTTANDTPFGLAGYVFSTDLDAAQALGRRIRFGEVKINGTSVIDLTPTSTQSFWGLSGVGGHGNAEVFRMFTGSQIVGVDHTDVPI
jgi:phenylacetaldehyde dehydrogenase